MASRPTGLHRRLPPRGMALIAALWILAVLMVLASSFSIAVRTETVLAGSYVHRTQASWLAEAGLQRAYLQLRDNPGLFTALHEDAQNEQPLVLYLDSEQDDAMAMQEGRFTVSAFDETALVNLNSVSEEILQRLLPTEPDVIDAILDWRDEDDEARQSGAESDYYAGLQEPYLSRNAPFVTTDELLLLRSMTAARLYGNEGLSPLASQDQVGAVDEALTPLTQEFTANSYDQNLTLDGAERVNVAQADQQQLQDALGDVLSEEDINSLVQYRDGGAGQGQGQGQGQANGTDLAQQVGALAGEQLPPELSDAAALQGADEAAGGPQPGGQNGQTRPSTVAELVSVLGREKMQQVYDRMTVSGDQRVLGLVNINTASRAVLAALPGMDEGLADAIIAARQEAPFETVGDLLGLSEITDEVFQEVAPLLTTRSLAYRLTAAGTVGEGEHAVTQKITAVVLLELQQQATAAGTENASATAETAATAEPTAPQRTLRLIYRRVE